MYSEDTKKIVLVIESRRGDIGFDWIGTWVWEANATDGQSPKQEACA